MFSALKDGTQLAIIIAAFVGFVGLVSGGYFWYKGKINTAVKVAVTKVQLDLALQAMKLQDRATEATWKLEENVLTLRKKKDAELKIAITKYDTMAKWVRDLPKSTANPVSSPRGANPAENTGADVVGFLHRQDAGDLTKYAKDAETIRLELQACYEQYDFVKTDLDQFRKNNTLSTQK